MVDTEERHFGSHTKSKIVNTGVETNFHIFPISVGDGDDPCIAYRMSSAVHTASFSCHRS